MCSSGDIGKTQTALALLCEFRKEYDAVFWASADLEKETEILRSFGAIGRKSRMIDTDDVDQVRLERILEWLKHTTKK